MNGFKPCIDPAEYFARLKELGYTAKRNGGPQHNTPLRNVCVLNVSVATGPGLEPCVVVAWERPTDNETTYLSSRRFDNERHLSDWLEMHRVTLSRHARSL